MRSNAPSALGIAEGGVAGYAPAAGGYDWSAIGTSGNSDMAGGCELCAPEYGPRPPRSPPWNGAAGARLIGSECGATLGKPVASAGAGMPLAVAGAGMP